jgi:hypothetical protein
MDWQSLLAGSGIVGALVASLFAAVTSWYNQRLTHELETLQARQEARAAIDVNLRELRLAVYKELWELTGVVPRWPRAAQPLADDVTYEDLRRFSDNLRIWYYTKGGWLLSTEAGEAYTPVQEAICNEDDGVLWAEAADGTRAIRTGPVTAADYDRVHDRCSELRSELTEDLHSRLAAPTLQ